MSPTGSGSIDLDRQPGPPVGTRSGTGGPGWVGRRLIGAIGLYQGARSGRPTGCRYVPTCSDYTSVAITEHGAARGALMGAKRVLRCTPWGGHGFDPVPAGRASCTHH